MTDLETYEEKMARGRAISEELAARKRRVKERFQPLSDLDTSYQSESAANVNVSPDVAEKLVAKLRFDPSVT